MFRAPEYFGRKILRRYRSSIADGRALEPQVRLTLKCKAARQAGGRKVVEGEMKRVRAAAYGAVVETLPDENNVCQGEHARAVGGGRGRAPTCVSVAMASFAV